MFAAALPDQPLHIKNELLLRSCQPTDTFRIVKRRKNEG
jgi:hypothetical protein